MSKKGNKRTNEAETFEVDEGVLAFHGPLLYDAKVLEKDMANKKHTKEYQYFVHYQKWSKKWDEWVGTDRLLKDSPDNRKYQDELKSQLKSKSAPKTGKRKAEKEAPGGKKARGGGKNKKQKTEEEDDTVDTDENRLNRKEIKLKIPGSLKKQLITDWENVTRKQQIVPLPRDPTVSKILEEYMKSKKGKTAATEGMAREVVDGLRQYFDRALGKLLLYRFERPQYLEQLRKETDKLQHPFPTSKDKEKDKDKDKTKADGGSSSGDKDKDQEAKQKAMKKLEEDYRGTPMSDIYGAEHLLRLFVKLPALLAHTQMSQKETTVLAGKLNDFVKWLAKRQAFFLNTYNQTNKEYAQKVDSRDMADGGDEPIAEGAATTPATTTASKAKDSNSASAASSSSTSTSAGTSSSSSSSTTSSSENKKTAASSPTRASASSSSTSSSPPSVSPPPPPAVVVGAASGR